MSVDDVSLDPAVERLNYRNGQRIVAADLRAEQSYHMGVRHWLNRTLFNPGIAKGLEVTPSPTNKHAVLVSPGLAIDGLGRELIVPTQVELPVSGIPSSSDGVVYGNYLVIEFREERGAPSGVECSRDSAPSRILSTPTMSVQSAWPTQESGRVPLAQVELDKQCAVKRVHTAIRKYASTSKPPKVRGISLEGEKGITATDSKTLYFHVRGGYPDAVSLYLRASRFSSSAYTEVGWHTHRSTGSTGDDQHDYTHNHAASGAQVSAAGDHTHDYLVDGGESTGGLDVNDDQVVGRRNTDQSAIMVAGSHQHTLQGLTINNALGPVTHRHSLDVASAGAGTDPLSPVRAGAPYAFFRELRIELDNVDITDQVRTQVQARSTDDWTRLGDGSQTHPLVVAGTGEIDLLQITSDLGPREHTLKLVPTSGGGTLHYNLYVE
ncbi:MAG TPA: hypothetical protein VIM19_18375 [Actinomycetes bacterium]